MYSQWRGRHHGVQELIRRWDSERERLRSAPRKLPGFAEITQNNAITPFKIIQGHRFWYQLKGHIRFPVMLNSNLPPILHRFRDIAVDRSRIAIFGYHSCLTPPAEGFPWDDLREIFSSCQWMAKVHNVVEILPKIWIAWVGRTNVTDDRQTTDRRTGNSK